MTKPFDPAELRARVRAALRTRRLVELLSKKAMVDGLTGLWNRTYLEMQLSREHSAARRSGHPLSCVMADVDRFKILNDTCGHGFGDDVLRMIAGIFTVHCRAEDVVCRYGGEEFTILLPNTPVRAPRSSPIDCAPPSSRKYFRIMASRSASPAASASRSCTAPSRPR